MILIIWPMLITAAWGQNADSWTIHWSKEKNATDPIVFVLVPLADIEDVTERLLSESSHLDHCFAIIPVDTANTLSVRDSINGALNDLDNIRLQRVYLMTIGPQRFFEHLVRFESQIFAHCAHWSTDSIPSTRNGWSMFSYQSNSLQDIVGKFRTQYLWNITLSRVQEESAVDISLPSKGFGIGYSSGPTFQFTKGTDQYVAKSFSKHRIQANKRLSDQWFIDLDFDFGMRRPNPQKVIREKIRDSVDISALLNGDEVEIALKETFEGHLFFGLAGSAKYVFRPQKNLRPYLKAGLGFDVLNSLSVEIDTSIVINPNQGNSGGFANGIANLTEDSGNSTSNINSLMVPLGIGTELKLSSRWMLDAEASYRYSLKAFNSQNAFSNSLQVMFGLKCRFSAQKRSYKYVE